MFKICHGVILKLNTASVIILVTRFRVYLLMVQLHQLINYKWWSGLATLLEDAGLAFFYSKVFKFSKIAYGCFKTVKFV